MLTEDEYSKLLPFRTNIMEGNANKTMLIFLNEILIRLNYGSICFDCSGSITRAVQDGKELIEQYEKALK